MTRPHRKHERTPIWTRLSFVDQATKAITSGVARDVSVTGMFIATADPAPFGASILVQVTLPGDDEEIVLPAFVRWVRPGAGMGVQFGLLGARATWAITCALSTFEGESPTTPQRRLSTVA